MLGTKLTTSSCLPVYSLETLNQPWPPSPPSLVALGFGNSSHVGLCSGAFWQTGTERWKAVNCWVRRQVSSKVASRMVKRA